MFKKGDKVRYVKAGPIGRESVDWAEGAGLKLGEVAEVEASDWKGKADPSVMILGFRMHPDHFEFAEAAATDAINVGGKWYKPLTDAEAADVIWGVEPAKPRSTTLPTDSAARKEFPIYRGGIRYFPAAIAGVARISKLGNDKHNPGEPMHHARGKSMDHGDCVIRHLMDVEDLIAAHERGGDVTAQHIIDEVNQFAWRALAFSQELHERFGAPLAPGAKS